MEPQRSGPGIRKDRRLAAAAGPRQHLRTTAMEMFLKWLIAGVLGALPASAAFAESHKILFLAGPRDHGAPGRHEYERDLRTLAQSLETASNLGGVTTQLVVGKASRDLALFKDVDARSEEHTSELQ